MTHEANTPPAGDKPWSTSEVEPVRKNIYREIHPIGVAKYGNATKIRVRSTGVIGIVRGYSPRDGVYTIMAEGHGFIRGLREADIEAA